MLTRLRRHLTYANVTATLALFVALGGTSYAALTITGRNVKNNSLTGKDVRGLTTSDVKNGALRIRDFAAGELPQLTTTVRRGGSSTIYECFSDCGGRVVQIPARADCLPGEQVTGGGVSPTTGDDAVVIESRPDPPGSSPTGWMGNVRYTIREEAASPQPPDVWVVCASP